jgi:hypothetical protein
MVPGFADRLKFHFTEGKNIKEVVEEIQTLPKDACAPSRLLKIAFSTGFPKYVPPPRLSFPAKIP